MECCYYRATPSASRLQEYCKYITQKNFIERYIFDSRKNLECKSLFKTASAREADSFSGQIFQPVFACFGYIVRQV